MRTIRGPLLGGLTLAASATLLLSAPTAGADQATLQTQARTAPSSAPPRGASAT